MKRFFKIILPALILGTFAAPLVSMGVAAASGAALTLVVSPSTGSAGTLVPASSITSTTTGGKGQSPLDGVITYYEKESSTAPSVCSGSGWNQIGSPVSPGTGSGNGTQNPSTGFTPVTAANYWLYATYTGDTNSNGAANTLCPPTSSQEIVVGKAATTLSLAGPASGTVGTAISGTSITGTLAGGSSPSGTITFYESGPSSSAPTTCPGTMTPIGTATVSANGAFHSSGGFTPSTPGNCWLYGSYGGDTNNTSSASSCPPTSSQEIVVGKAATSSNVVSDNVSASTVTGDSFTFTDTIVGVDGITPSGSVTWSVTGPGGTVLSCANVGSTTLAGSGGTATATCQINNALAGQYSAYAVYGGDTNYLTSTSNTDTPTVSQASTASNVVSDNVSASTVTGDSFTFTDTIVGVDGITPSGSVTWSVTGPGGTVLSCANVGSTTLAGSGGTATATCQINNALAGQYSAYAVYGGDTNYLTSTSNTDTPTVSQASTASNVVSDNVSASTVTGDSFTFTDTIVGVDGITPSGSGPWSVTGPGGTVLSCANVGSTTLAGSGGTATATCQINNALAGQYSAYAVYGGDTNYLTSTSNTDTPTVSQASTASNVVSDNVSASTVTGDSFTFTDTIVGVDGITPSGSVPRSGPGPGGPGLPCAHAGSAPPPSGPVPWSGTGPGGTVLSCANVGSTTLAGSGGTATATCQINNALAGQYSAYAVYGGDTNYLTSTSNTDTPTVSQASTASNVVSDNVSASTVTGDSFTFTDTIVGVDGITPSGSGPWSVTGPGGTVLSCANVGSTTLAGSGGTATATCQINNALAGQYSAYAVYGGGRH